MSSVKVVVRIPFHASPKAVYQAWLNPELIGRWMFGRLLREEEVLGIVIDARVGGNFSFLVRRDGHEIDHVGEYLELLPFEKLLFTWAIRENLPDTSRVMVKIEPAGEGCEVELQHEPAPAWADFVGRTEEAWKKMLTVLKHILEGNG